MERDTIDFECGKVPVLFRKLLIPTLFGTLAQSSVSVIDGIFVGHGVGSNGLAAVNIVAPVYSVMSGIGLMIGVGCSVTASIHAARQKMKVARLNVAQALIASTLFTVAVCIAIMLFPKESVQLLGTSSSLLPQAAAYLFWIAPCFAFQMWCLIGLFIIRLDGSPRFAMWCNIVPAAANIILDWYFIMVLGMGVKGAAIATSISVIMGGMIAMVYLLFFAKSFTPRWIKASMKSLRLSLRNIGYQARLGFPTLLGELTLAVLIFTGNQVFIRYLGDAGVGAFGIACYYTPFFFTVGNSIAQSAQPIISYNYGAARQTQIRQALRLLLGTSVVSGLVVSFLFLFAPNGLVALFVNVQSNAGQIAISGFPYYATGIVFFILNVAIIGYYQSIERIRRATLYVFLRGFLLLVPCFVFLPMQLGAKGIWLAMPLTEFLTFAFIMLQWLRGRNKTAKYE